jgi:hypothetical protein
LRGKILDFAYYYNTATNSDSNSRFVLSPTVATPLIAQISGEDGQSTSLAYTLKRGNTEVYLRTANLLPWTGFRDCSNLAGAALTDSMNRSFDSCGSTLPKAKNTGNTYAKSFAYTPADSVVGLAVFGNGAIIEPTPTNPSTGVSPLMGIPGMRFNDKATNSIADTLYSMFSVIEEKNACIASTGNREIIFWPEEDLFKEKPASTDPMSEKESDLKDTCVKVI